MVSGQFVSSVPAGKVQRTFRQRRFDCPKFGTFALTPISQTFSSAKQKPNCQRFFVLL